MRPSLDNRAAELSERWKISVRSPRLPFSLRRIRFCSLDNARLTEKPGQATRERKGGGGAQLECIVRAPQEELKLMVVHCNGFYRVATWFAVTWCRLKTGARESLLEPNAQRLLPVQSQKSRDRSSVRSWSRSRLESTSASDRSTVERTRRMLEVKLPRQSNSA